MKKLITLAFLICSAWSAGSQTVYPGGISGCIARWDFTAPATGSITTLQDVSNNSHNGTAYNLTTAAGFRNTANKAIKFNGTSSYAEVLNDTSLNPQKITIIALVRPDGFYSGSCQGNNIIYKSYQYYVPGCWAMEFADNTYDNNCSVFSPNKMQMDFAGSVTGTYTIPQGNYITLNKWYFFAITYDGNIVKRYQVEMDTNSYLTNTAPISTNNFGYSLGTNNYNVRIGATQNPPFPYWFNGNMDEVVLFNRVLSDTDIHTVYTYLYGKVLINKPFNDTALCQGASFVLPFTVSDYYQGGSTFTVELSDASGSFANPVNIGTVSSSVSGNISCTIPVNTPPGNGYRVRIVPSVNTNLTSDDNGINIKVSAALVPSVVIGANPGTVITPGQQVTFNATVTNGGAGIIYQWRKNGVNISGATSNTYSTNNIAGSDVISVVIHTGSACVFPDSAISNYLVMIKTGIETSLSGIDNVTLSPNPNNGRLLLAGYISRNTETDITIINAFGQIVYNKKQYLEKGKFENEIILENTIANGVYILQLKSGSTKKSLLFSLYR